MLVGVPLQLELDPDIVGGDVADVEQVQELPAHDHVGDALADVQLRWQPLRDVDLILNYAYVHIDSDETDIEDSSPKHNLSALGIYRMPHGWEASVGVYRVGEMEWLDDGGPTEQYIRVDARRAKRWKWERHEAELSLVGQNLGGDRYEEFRYNNLFDSRAYVGLTLDW